MSKARPIIFSAPTVRAILDGRKTQTRRAVKLPHANPLGAWEPMTIGGPNGGRTKAGDIIPEQGAIWHTRTGECLASTYGQPGDRLWVRETFFATAPFAGAPLFADRSTHIAYRADGESIGCHKWKPSIHMPRSLSRIDLEITGIRVERLQEISEADAQAEGARCVDAVTGREVLFPIGSRIGSYRVHYRAIWESIHGAGSWESNPFVWVIEFRSLADGR